MTKWASTRMNENLLDLQVFTQAFPCLYRSICWYDCTKRNKKRKRSTPICGRNIWHTRLQISLTVTSYTCAQTYARTDPPTRALVNRWPRDCAPALSHPTRPKCPNMGSWNLGASGHRTIREGGRPPHLSSPPLGITYARLSECSSLSPPPHHPPTHTLTLTHRAFYPPLPPTPTGWKCTWNGRVPPPSLAKLCQKAALQRSCCLHITVKVRQKGRTWKRSQLALIWPHASLMWPHWALSWPLLALMWPHWALSWQLLALMWPHLALSWPNL
jgi:hypothetical protein